MKDVDYAVHYINNLEISEEMKLTRFLQMPFKRGTLSSNQKDEIMQLVKDAFDQSEPLERIAILKFAQDLARATEPSVAIERLEKLKRMCDNQIKGIPFDFIQFQQDNLKQYLGERDDIPETKKNEIMGAVENAFKSAKNEEQSLLAEKLMAELVVTMEEERTDAFKKDAFLRGGDESTASRKLKEIKGLTSRNQANENPTSLRIVQMAQETPQAEEQRFAGELRELLKGTRIGESDKTKIFNSLMIFKKHVLALENKHGTDSSVSVDAGRLLNGMLDCLREENGKILQGPGQAGHFIKMIEASSKLARDTGKLDTRDLNELLTLAEKNKNATPAQSALYKATRYFAAAVFVVAAVAGIAALLYFTGPIGLPFLKPLIPMIGAVASSIVGLTAPAVATVASVAGVAGVAGLGAAKHYVSSKRVGVRDVLNESLKGYESALKSLGSESETNNPLQDTQENKNTPQKP